MPFLWEEDVDEKPLLEYTVPEEEQELIWFSTRYVPYLPVILAKLGPMSANLTQEDREEMDNPEDSHQKKKCPFK